MDSFSPAVSEEHDLSHHIKVCESEFLPLNQSLSQPLSDPHTIEDSDRLSTTDINISDNLMVTGFDVKSLYPSLRDVDTAAIARESIIHSKLDFRGLDVNKALAYLRIVAGTEVMRAAGLTNFIPRWTGEKVDSLRVTGLTGRNMDSWIFAAQTPSLMQIKQIIGLVVEVGVLIAMGSHVYQFYSYGVVLLDPHSQPG